jgi:Bacterial toxin 33
MVMASDGDMSAHELRDERPACQTTTPATSFSAYSEIKKLKQIIGSIEQFKEELGARPASRFDLYKCRNGDIVIKRKGDSQGPGESTGYNVYSL